MANTTKSRLVISSLDFDDIKASLKTFLSAQSYFQDYNFEGSGLSVLIDLLAYNTHLTGFYQHMIANEMFMDTATLRSSIVSRAKLLGYTPISTTSARAVVNITIVPPDNPASIIIDRGTRFNAVIDGKNYVFITDEAHITTPMNGVYAFSDVTLVEGTPYAIQFTYDATNPTQRFIIPNATVDTSTLDVIVQTSVTNNTQTVFELVDDITLVTDTSLIYYLQEVENELYEVQFGDGVLGKPLEDGNIIIVNYQVSSGAASNGATGFAPISYVGGYANNVVTVTTVTSAFGGSPRETTDDIRFMAPRSFEAQDRAVTVQDYKTLLAQDYPDAASVAVWGGEDQVPPSYGKVFISIKPVEGYVLTATAKKSIIDNILRKRNVVSIIPEIVDPDYTFILANCEVWYDPTVTIKTSQDIANTVIQAIVAYGTTDLSQFGLALKYSRLLNAVDNADTSISNNYISIQMQKRFNPTLGISQAYSFNFNNPIQPDSFASSHVVIVRDPQILYSVGDLFRIIDDGNGNLNITRLSVGSTTEVVVKPAGTINYMTGVVDIVGFMPQTLNGATDCRLTCTPQEPDINPALNNILVMNAADIKASTFIGKVTQ